MRGRVMQRKAGSARLAPSRRAREDLVPWNAGPAVATTTRRRAIVRTFRRERRAVGARRDSRVCVLVVTFSSPARARLLSRAAQFLRGISRARWSTQSFQSFQL